MPKKEKIFSNGETLFKQGEPCTTVFTIVEGQAELFAEINGRRRVLGRRKADDVLGGDDALNGVYAASARALTDLVVTVKTADEYISGLQKSGEMSPRFRAGQKGGDDESNDGGFDFSFGDDEDVSPAVPVRKRPSSRALKKKDREEEADFPFEEEEPPKPERNQALVKVEKQRTVPVPSNSFKPAVLPANPKKSSVSAWLNEGRAAEPLVGTVLLLASIDGDDNGEIRDSLYRILRQIPDLVVKVVNGVVTDPNGARAAMQMRSWMEPHDADFGLYARLDNAGRLLEFNAVRKKAAGADSPVSVGTRFFLPVRMEPYQETLLKAFTVSAVEPVRLEHEQLLRLFLPSLLDEIAPRAAEPMPGLTPEEQGANLTCYANALSLVTLFGYSGNLYSRAAEVYEKASELLPPYAPEYVFVNRQTGLIRQLQGEQNRNVEDFRKAEETFRKVLKTLSARRQPKTYGDLKLRIGKVRQRIAENTSERDDFTEAMSFYRDAMRIINPADDPEKWADAVNGLAHTMQVYSCYGTKTDMLKKAVDLYEKEFSVLDRDKTPLLWARAGNNLASALFMMSGRKGGDIDLLRRAVEVFSDALSVYDGLGVTKLAEIAKKNLFRAEKAIVETEKMPKPPVVGIETAADEAPKDDADKNADVIDEPLVFERIAVFEELDDE